MKSLLTFVLLLIVSFMSVSAEYIEGQEKNQTDGMMTTTSVVVDDTRVCTMDYTPVCAEVQIQCVMAPCYPLKQTFSNACSAGDNPILFQGECSTYMNDSLYNKYEAKREAVQNILSKVNIKTLKRINTIIDQRIEMVKMSRISVELQKERITKYAFIKSVVNAQLSTK